jgi:hypothetical protein
VSELAKRALGYLVYAAIFYLIFGYVAGMPMRWSIVLALVIAGIHRNLLHLAPKSLARFTPYYLNVIPKWYEILTDYKIISGKEQWETIENTWKEKPYPEHLFIRDGMSLVFVSESDNAERTLIYSNDYQVFMSEIDVRENLHGVTIPNESETMQRNLGDYEPRFFIKIGMHGYDLGIEVQNSWWERIKAICPKPLDEKQEHLFGTVKLVLAKIPLEEFTPYWEPVEYDSNFHERFEKKQKQGREKYGWTAQKFPDDEPWRTRWPTQIEHRYCSVEHSDI